MGNRKTEVILALDTQNLEEARELVRLSLDLVKIFKVGPILFISHGLKGLGVIKDAGGEVFLDLKLHDIPNTVKGAARAASSLEIKMLTLHLAGGIDMLKAAIDGIEEGSGQYGKRTLLIGVTRLTSMAAEEANEITRLAGIAAQTGLDGIVCSAKEVASIRQAHGDGLITVVPGIRLKEDERDDQVRVATPGEAARAGADFIVVGRTVTRSRNPQQVLERLIEEVERA